MSNVTTRVVFHPEVVDLLEFGVAEGVRDTAEAGKERALQIARGKFKTIRRFESTAFSAGFANGQKVGVSHGRHAPRVPDDKGPGVVVAYYGYDWFVARFYETGTVRQLPRPSLAPSAMELGGIMPGRLKLALSRKGF